MIVCDLDGVLWLGDSPIAGAADAIAELRAAGHRLVFASNFSFALPGELASKLEGMGVAADGDVVTASMAAGALVKPGERVLVLGGPGVFEAVHEAGGEAVDATAAQEPPARGIDTVVVGFRDDVTWDHLRRASTAVRAGARFIATGTDATLPTADGPVPGTGAIVAAVAVASGCQPAVAGKPFGPMADLITGRFGPASWVVGDRGETDGAFAQTLGAGWALVLSGVTHSGDLPVAPTPDVVDDDLAGFAARVRCGALREVVR